MSLDLAQMPEPPTDPMNSSQSEPAVGAKWSFEEFNLAACPPAPTRL